MAVPDRRRIRDAEANARAETERLRADARELPGKLILAGARLSAQATRFARAARKQR